MANTPQLPDLEGILDSDLRAFVNDILHQEGGIDYDHASPPGGAHNAVWQNCGIYDEPVPAEAAVHSLEHGAVWITYQPALTENELASLQKQVRQALANRDEPMVILSPQPEQTEPIIATAWQVQLTLESADDARLQQFLDQYQVGPYTPEPSAPCTGGVGEPMS